MTYKVLAPILLLLAAAPAFSQQVKVAENIQTITFNGVLPPGEAQSTVVPPGKNQRCSGGRFLVSNDQVRPDAINLTNGIVVGRDLSGRARDPFPAVIKARFDQPPNAPDYLFSTNDHDLVSLSTGEVLYLTGAFSKRRLTPSPPWFDVTYRDGFGPGARSVVLVWLSGDCGETFKYIAEFDPAQMEDGQCAMPQPMPPNPNGRDSGGNFGKPFIRTPVFNAGGTDGQLVKVDPITDKVYMTFQCVGRLQDKAITSHFDLQDVGVFKTIVATLERQQSSEGFFWNWRSLGYINNVWWRFGIVPLGSGELGLGLVRHLVFGTRDRSGMYSFNSDGQATPEDDYDWDDTFYKNRNIWGDCDGQVTLTLNIRGRLYYTVVGRTPGAKGLFIAYPVTVSGKGHGYHLYFYDRTTGLFGDDKTETRYVLPAAKSANNFILHPVVIDYGVGPVLLYWTDVNTDAKTATVRGRFITGNGEYSPDFNIAQVGGQPHYFDLKLPPQRLGSKCTPPSLRYWFGDYQTAGGFAEPSSSPFLPSPYIYYPMWIEPDQTIRYTRVEYDPARGNDGNVTKIKLILIPMRKPAPTPVRLDRIRPSEREYRELREYDIRPR
jgi:hypothetical protein